MTHPTVKIDHRDIILQPLPPGYDDTAAGLYESANSSIYIDPNVSSQEQARLLLHELLHAVWDIRQLPKKVTEEQACGLLDGALATILRDNVWLLSTFADALNHGRTIFDECPF